MRAVERFRGRPAPSDAGTVYTFDGPVRAANCALRLSRPERRIAVRAGEVSHTPHGLEGGAIDVLAGLLTAASPGSVLPSCTLRELALGSGLEFTPAGQAKARGLGDIDGDLDADGT